MILILYILRFHKLTGQFIFNINFTEILFFEDKHLCRNNPCGAHGECFENEHSYTCICEAGYTGLRCLESKLLELFFNLLLIMHIIYMNDKRKRKEIFGKMSNVKSMISIMLLQE